KRQHFMTTQAQLSLFSGAFLCVAARWFAPAGLFVQRRLREAAQGVNGASISLNRSRRQKRTRWLIHKRHKLVGKARHRTPDADAADVGTSANAAHPSTLAHVALNHRPPTPQLHNAKWRSVFFSK